MQRDPTPSALPAQSQASLRHGIWFVFPLEPGTVRAWGSCLSGLERVYVDDRLVSERRNLGLGSSHAFPLGGRSCSVSFHTADVLRGRLECTLAEEGTVLRTAVARYVGTQRLSSARLAFYAALGLAAGVFLSRQALPPWAGWVGLAGLLLLAVHGARSARFEVEHAAPVAAPDGPGAPGQ